MVPIHLSARVDEFRQRLIETQASHALMIAIRFGVEINEYVGVLEAGDDVVTVRRERACSVRASAGSRPWAQRS